MTHAGMVPVLENAVDLGEGLYQVDFNWSMAGDWILELSGELPDGRYILREFRISVETQ